jgi:hypothetical protein
MFTRCGLLQERLQVRGQLYNVVRRSGPEHKTVPGVLETRLEVWVLQPQQDGINAQPVELRGQELVSLLRIPRRPMRCVECLKFGLHRKSVD